MSSQDIQLAILGKQLIKKGFREWYYFFSKQIFNKNPIKHEASDKIIKAIEEIENIDTTMPFEKRFGARRIVNAPPRSTKSTILTFYMAFVLARDPTSKFIYISYSNDLLRIFSCLLKDILQNKLYKSLYNVKTTRILNLYEEQGEVRVVDDSELKKDNFTNRIFELSGGGKVRFASSLSAITGFGASNEGIYDYITGGIIYDDPNDPKDRYSIKKKEKVVSNYTSSTITRIDNKATGFVCVLQQRTSPDDLTGRLLEIYGDEFTLTKIPLEKEDGTLTINTYTEKALQEIKKDKYTFYTQYQQEPVNLEGVIIDTDRFKRYNEVVNEFYFDMYFMTTDYSFTKNINSDDTCLCLWGVKQNKEEDCVDFYLIDCISEKMKLFEKLNATREFYKKWNNKETKYHTIRVFEIFTETHRNDDFMELIKGDNLPFYLFSRTQGKKERASIMMFHLGVSYNIYIPYPNEVIGENMIKRIITQCNTFTGDDGNHDDICDNIIDACLIGMRRF